MVNFVCYLFCISCFIFVINSNIRGNNFEYEQWKKRQHRLYLEWYGHEPMSQKTIDEAIDQGEDPNSICKVGHYNYIGYKEIVSD